MGSLLLIMDKAHFHVPPTPPQDVFMRQRYGERTARSRTAPAIRIKFDGNFPQSQMAVFHKISPQIPCLPSLSSPWKPHIKTIPSAGRKVRNKGKIKNRTMTTVELIKSIAFDFGWTVSTDEEEDHCSIRFPLLHKAWTGLRILRRADRKQIWRVSWGCGAVLRGLWPRLWSLSVDWPWRARQVWCTLPYQGHCGWDGRGEKTFHRFL